MDTVLIVGLQGVVGGNLAAVLSERHVVAGVAPHAMAAPGGAVEVVTEPDPERLSSVIRRHRPARVVLCGASAANCWSGLAPTEQDVAETQAWVAAATDAGCALTLVSSDAVFTGPWMFHAENSTSLCASAGAQRLREMEQLVQARRPDALIVRTHAFGWSPLVSDGTPSCWLESLLHELRQGNRPAVSCVPHASPILVTDLASVLEKAWSVGLAGVYHVAGAERVSAAAFVRRLSQEFQLDQRTAGATASLTTPATGFGLGETSLQTRKIRRALGIALPMLNDGLRRLHEQTRDGHLDRLRGNRGLRRAA